MNAITLLTETDIERIVSNAVGKALSANGKEYQKMIGTKDAARLLKRSEQTIHRWSCQNYKDIPVIKGGRLLFNLDELKGWAARNGMQVEN